MTAAEQEAAMEGHPLIWPLFAGAGRPCRLEDVMEELATLGLASLSCRTEANADGPVREWTAALLMPGEREIQAGGGATARLAALRCLMEGLTHLQRIARSSLGPGA